MNPFIVLGLDGASSDVRKLLESADPIPGLWGEKIGDDVLWNGAKTQLGLGFRRKFVDLKHYDTPGRLQRIIEGYAKLENPPTLLSISGEINSAVAFKKFASVRGKVGLIATGPLSSWDNGFCLDKFSMTASAWMEHILTLAVEGDLQGVTCPAWLLEDESVKKWLAEIRKEEEFIVVATGIRSTGVPAGNHVQPRTPAFAIQHGASLVVIESEVVGAPGYEPLEKLRQICESV